MNSLVCEDAAEPGAALQVRRDSTGLPSAPLTFCATTLNTNTHFLFRDSIRRLSFTPNAFMHSHHTHTHTHKRVQREEGEASVLCAFIVFPQFAQQLLYVLHREGRDARRAVENLRSRLSFDATLTNYLDVQ